MSTTRLFFLAANDAVVIQSVIKELQVGRNELTQDECNRYSRCLLIGDGSSTSKRRRQVSRVLWDVFHGPYDERWPGEAAEKDAGR